MTIEDKAEGKLSREGLQPQEGDHVLGYGMLEVPETLNVTFTAWVRDGKSMCCLRMRTYVDDKIHDSDDKRKWITLTPKKPMAPEQWWEYCLGRFEALRETLPETPAGCDPILYSVAEVNGSYREWTEKFLAEPYVHVRFERAPSSTVH